VNVGELMSTASPGPLSAHYLRIDGPLDVQRGGEKVNEPAFTRRADVVEDAIVDQVIARHVEELVPRQFQHVAHDGTDSDAFRPDGIDQHIRSSIRATPDTASNPLGRPHAGRWNPKIRANALDRSTPWHLDANARIQIRVAGERGGWAMRG
jgi:hypothetical protein